MTGSVIKFNQLYNTGVELILPYYQRCAVWSQDKGSQLSTLVDDMLSLIEIKYKYYIGSILMEDLYSVNDINGASRYFLLDGQQRLTMITLIMLALYIKQGNIRLANVRLMHNDGTPILTLQREDRPDFERIMSHTTLDGVSGDSCLVKSFNYICQRVKEFDGDAMEVINKINMMEVNQLIITNDTNSQLVFDRENGSGVKLTTGELIKNYLFHANESDYYDIWHPVFCATDVRNFWDYDTSKEGMRKSEHNVMLDRFLHIVIRILCWQFKGHSKWMGSDAREFVKENNLYWSYKELVERFGMAKIDLAKEISEYGKLYLKHFNTMILDQSIPSTPCVERIACLVHSKGCYVIMPYILYVLRNVDSKAERNKIFGLIENYMMRLILAKNDNAGKRLSEFFSERLICSEVLTANRLADTIDSVEGQHRMPNDEEIGNCLTENKFKKTDMKVILYMYECRTGNCRMSFNMYSVCPLIPIIKIDKRHHVVTDEDMRGIKLSEGLGNYILVRNVNAEELKKLSKADWTIRRSGLMSASIGINTSTNLLKTSRQMDVNHIENRIKCLATCFNTKLWPAA